MPLNDYFNPSALNPGNEYKPQGWMGGAMWRRDRDRYEKMMDLQRDMALQSLFQERLKSQEAEANVPVNAAKRLAEIQQHRGTADTAYDMAIMNRENAGLDTLFKQQTLSPRVAQVQGAAAASEHGVKMQKLKESLSLLDTMADEAVGPDGAARMLEKLRGMGYDEKHPLINFVTSAGSPDEMRQRAQYASTRLHSLESGYSTELLRQQGASGRAVLEANAGIDRALINERTPMRDGQRRADAYYARLKEENDRKPYDQRVSDAVLRARAQEQADTAQYGLGRYDNAQSRERENAIFSARSLLSKLPPGTDAASQAFRKGLEDHIRMLESQRGTTPDNAINLD